MGWLILSLYPNQVPWAQFGDLLNRSEAIWAALTLTLTLPLTLTLILTLTLTRTHSFTLSSESWVSLSPFQKVKDEKT